MSQNFNLTNDGSAKELNITLGPSKRTEKLLCLILINGISYQGKRSAQNGGSVDQIGIELGTNPTTDDNLYTIELSAKDMAILPETGATYQLYDMAGAEAVLIESGTITISSAEAAPVASNNAWTALYRDCLLTTDTSVVISETSDTVVLGFQFLGANSITTQDVYITNATIGLNEQCSVNGGETKSLWFPMSTVSGSAVKIVPAVLPAGEAVSFTNDIEWAEGSIACRIYYLPILNLAING